MRKLKRFKEFFSAYKIYYFLAKKCLPSKKLKKDQINSTIKEK